jgi:predicted dienelactone hydrolase
MGRLVAVACCVGLSLFFGAAWVQGAAAPGTAGPGAADPGGAGPYSVDSISVSITNPDNGHVLSTDIYFPGSGGQVDPASAPYATLVFARGFLSTPSNYSGNGTHLASWGYIVALADFPSEDIEARAIDARYVFTYLEAQNATVGGKFYHRIDVQRFGVLGHSLGGLTSLMVASRDARVKAAVALDPVNPPASAMTPWDYATEAPNIKVATTIVGAPPQLCNSSANYREMYPAVGADHKAQWVITNGNHCDFVDTPDALQRAACYFICGGTYDAARVQTMESYTTAWFNYYLRGHTEYYPYLYGAAAQADISAGRVTATVNTAPRKVTAQGQIAVIALSWELSNNPLVAGYNVYRSTVSGAHPAAPTYQTGRAAGFLDNSVITEQPYFYQVASRDAAGGEHQLSAEVSATAGAASHWVWLPMLYSASSSAAQAAPHADAAGIERSPR